MIMGAKWLATKIPFLIICSLLFVLILDHFMVEFEGRGRIKQMQVNEIDWAKHWKKAPANTSSFIKRKPKSEVKEKTILIWSTREKYFSFLPRYNKYLKDNGHKCTLTSDKKLYTQSAAVVLASETVSDAELPDPKLRTPDQYFVYWAIETPAKLYNNGKFMDQFLQSNEEYDAMFNLTWYFRRDADIVHYFGSVNYALRTSYDKRNNDFKVLMDKKDSLVGWAVSNCDHTKGSLERMVYAKKLISAGLNLTTFGKCFDNFNKEEVRLFDNFKFWLSFENSIHCPDYITEKLWKNSFKVGAVPIVFGPTKADVEIVAPKNSYIHVDDFAKAEDLVDYLNYLDSNDDAYLEYHKWRLNEIEEGDVNGPILEDEFAKLCSVISDSPTIRKTYSSMKDWLFSDKYYVDDECLKLF